MLNEELYNVLKSLGADEDLARSAARSVVSAEEVATKVDLAQIEARLDGRIDAIKSDIIKWMMTGFLAQTAVLLTIVGIVT